MSESQPAESAGAPAHVLVIGGGFGGINVVRGLRHAPVSITLVDRHNYHVFQPLLYQVATFVLEPAGIAVPIRQLVRKQKNVTVAMTEALGVDLKRQRVRFRKSELEYDYLVIATGVETTYFGNDQFKTFAPGMKSIEDAEEVRRRILLAFEAAEWEADRAAREAELTFVIVGGGPTGVELAGAISDTARRTLPKDFRHIDTTTTRVILLDGGDRLAKAMPAKVSTRIQRDLEEMGVEIRLQTRVTAVDKHGVYVGDELIPANNVFWAAGVQGVPLAYTLDVERDRAGRIVVGPDLAIPDYANAFVIGDAAAATDAKTGGPVPGLAQGAIQGGKFVAKIIDQSLAAGAVTERPAFSYFDKGSMAIIGRGKGVTLVGEHFFAGFLGWLAWCALHAAFLVGLRRKIVVTLLWFWNYLVNERAARIILGESDAEVFRVLTPAEADDATKRLADPPPAAFDDE